MTIDLLDAVDRLTQPVRERVEQEILITRMQDGRPVTDDNGNPVRDVKGTHKITVTHPPLLTQLEDAIASTMGGGSGKAMKDPAALDVLDSDALYQFTLISNEIREWCRLVGVNPRQHPIDALRAWYAATLAFNDRDDTWHVEKLRAWAGMIRGKLAPSNMFELTAPCPECEATAWVDDEGDAGPFPVKITYRADSTDILATATASCKACGHEWRGSAALRALRWEVDNIEHAEKTGA